MSTYTPIASQTLSSAASSITFTNIPQNFTDLILVTNEKQTSTRASALRFNSDTGSNYSQTGLYGTGSTAGSFRTTNSAYLYYGYYAFSTTSNFNFNSIVQINNYSNTTTNKTVLSRANNADNGVDAIVGLWRNTAAVTSITLTMENLSNFSAGSTFSLYGIIAGTAKASGGTVTTDGTYFYHTFTSSGVFAPLTNLTADYLIVAGGAGGGAESAGGGGAGGLRCTVGATGGGGTLETAIPLTAQNYIVTVGAGGSGGALVAGTALNANSGSNSVFATITSIGGGYGGTGSGTSGMVAGVTGGSGGGGSRGFNAAGSGTANQGYAGGIGGNASSTGAAGGGGGGAGAVGANAGTTAGVGPGGAGGNGVTTTISGSSVTYAGGGGGGVYDGTAGAGGTGGGGAGSRTDASQATSGTANTGGGGGGGGLFLGGQTRVTGGNGGSGIVIIRYAV